MKIFEEPGRCIVFAVALLLAPVAGLSAKPMLAAPVVRVDPCARERAAWRDIQTHAPKLGRERPQRWWTAQALMLQCLRQHER